MNEGDFDLLRPTVFHVGARVTLEAETAVLVTPGDVIDYFRHGGRGIAERLGPEGFMEWIAEQIAAEASGPLEEWHEVFDPDFDVEPVRVGDDPAVFLKEEGPVWKGDGKEAAVSDLQATRVDRYGRPLPPPPIPGQEQLAV